MDYRKGNAEAASKLVPFIDAELRRLLPECLPQETAAHELRAASLITDAYVALLPAQDVDHSGRLLFASLATPCLRRLLLDYAVRANSPGPSVSNPGFERYLLFDLKPYQFIALDEGLNRLATLDDKQSRIVELKLFAGLREEDIGDLLVCSAQSVRSAWRLSRAWLYEQLTGSDAETIAREITASDLHSTPTQGLAATAAARPHQKRVEWTPARWQWVSKLFIDAVSEDYAQRSTWLRDHCHGDAQLEVQLGLLLAADQRLGKFLEAGGLLTVDYPPIDRLTHSLDCGQVISGRFQILRFVDSGGMGEVYEAWDLELKERVALKTIRPEVASNPAVIERFKREVKQARGISHPNVCRVYDLFSHGESSQQRIWFLTMELLEGETLLEDLRRRQHIPSDEIFPLVEQMVSGLAAAHKLGIVHRDFKSGNVMLVHDGAGGRTRAVITDFGLSLNIASIDLPAVEQGGEGTPDYMAPEQRQSGAVGFAADQYALGVVICEMLTGYRPRRSTLATPTGEAAVLPPDESLPPRWERVIRRCLQVRPEDRYASVTDVIFEFDRRKRRNDKLWIVAGAMIALAGFVFLAWPHPAHLVGITQLTPITDFSLEPSISRDGMTAAYSSDRAEAGNLDIWVQHLPSGSPVRLTTDPAEDRAPSVSPDGRSVVFRSSRNGGGIYISSAAGGGERLLVPAGRSPVFSPDGRQIAYWVGQEDNTVASGQLYVLSLAGGVPVRLAADFRDARFPIWSSDGNYILFSGCRSASQVMPACSDWWVTSLDGNTVRNTGALQQLRALGIAVLEQLGGWQGADVVFSGRQGQGKEIRNLWQIALSRGNFAVRGAARQLTDTGDVDGTSSVAENGAILFSRLAGALHIWRINNGSDPETAVTARVTQDASVDICPYISANGRWLVFSRGFGNHHDIWMKDTRTGAESLFLASNNDKASPVVDESGTTVVFEARDRGTPSLLVAHRGDAPRVLCSGCSKPTSWFNGTRAIFYRDGLPSKIKMIDPETGEASTVLEAPNASLSEASWSPESQYLLFAASAEGGKKRIFAVSFPKATGVPTGPWIPITSESEWSDNPRWAGDGKTVFYLSTRDGFGCIWGQHFDPALGKPIGAPFPVMHYHNARLSPDTVIRNSFDLSVSGDSIYLNLGESRDTIWTGVLKHKGFLSFLNWRR